MYQVQCKYGGVWFPFPDQFNSRARAIAHMRQLKLGEHGEQPMRVAKIETITTEIVGEM